MARRRVDTSTPTGQGVAVVGTLHDREERGRRVSPLPLFHPEDWRGDSLREKARAYARAVAPAVKERSPGAIAVAAEASWKRFERTGSDAVYLRLEDAPGDGASRPYTPPTTDDVLARLELLTAGA